MNWLFVTMGLVMAVGCATPQYAVRQTPVPEEGPSAIQIERTVSAYQAREFARQGARPLGRDEQIAGFGIQPLIDRLGRVTERPSLAYRAYLYEDQDSNAAALADGRIYLSTGLLAYLAGRGPPRQLSEAGRGSRADEPFDSPRHGGARSGRMPSEVEAELASIVGHELAHTVAQHLVKRYRLLQQQQLLIALVAAGTAAATRNASAGVQRAGELALDAASLIRDVHNSGYSQEQELEADQLGIRYVIKAGYDPKAALDLLQDFARFDTPWPFLRTHPYITLRRAYLKRYLEETGHVTPHPAGWQPLAERGAAAQRLRQLRQTQRLYPAGSVSWKNLQRQIDELAKTVASR